MKRYLMAFCMVLGLAAAALPVRADDDEWFRVAELTANGKGDAKEVTVGKKIDRIRIVVTEGSVIINGIAVRHEGKADYHKVAQRFEKGARHVIYVLDGKQRLLVDGLRISDDGKGSYVVQARR